MESLISTNKVLTEKLVAAIDSIAELTKLLADSKGEGRSDSDKKSITAGRTDADTATTASDADSKQKDIKTTQLLINSVEILKIFSILWQLET